MWLGVVCAWLALSGSCHYGLLACFVWHELGSVRICLLGISLPCFWQIVTLRYIALSIADKALATTRLAIVSYDKTHQRLKQEPT